MACNTVHVVCLADATRAVPTVIQHSRVGTIETAPPSPSCFSSPSCFLDSLLPQRNVKRAVIDMLAPLPPPLRRLRRQCRASRHSAAFHTLLTNSEHCHPLLRIPSRIRRI